MTQFEYEETRQDLPRRKPIPKKETDPSDPSGRTSSSCTRSFMRADRDGRDLGFTSQTRCRCSCGQLPKPNRETTRFSHTKRETRKPPFFAPILTTPTRSVLFPLYFLGFGPILLCVLEEVCRPTSPRPGFGSSTSRKTKRQKEWRADEEARRRDKVEPKVVQRWHLGLLFLLLVRGNDAGGAQAHLVRRRRRQRRKKTTALKWRDRTAGCAADVSRFRAKRWCRGLA